MKLIKSFVTGACVVAASTALAPTSAKAAMTPVTVNFATTQSSLGLAETVPLKVAIDKGMLKKQGIILKIVIVNGGVDNVQALDARKADIAVSATNDLVTAVVKDGVVAVAVVGGPQNFIYSIVSAPGIKTLADLKGKPIAVSAPADIISIATKNIVDNHGFTDKDYVPKVLLNSKLRGQCLTSGACGAAVLAQPFDIVLAEKGYHILATSHDVIQNMQYTVFAVLPSWAEAHKDIVVRFAKAMAKADEYAYDPAHKAEIISMLMSMTHSSKAVATQSYHVNFESDLSVIPEHAEISVPGVTEVIQLMGDSGALDVPLPSADRFVDLQYLQTAGLQ
jgi:ABC-type nitrate/sulfonate/bicarbonate transport system substrate-binding protein